jgi:putative RNA 2'-phosphotransferase
MSRDRLQLSKTLSHALRHAPDQYGLQLDPEGWVTVEDMLAALAARRPAWRHLRETDLIEVNESVDKRRFEIVDGRVRALYGHSIKKEKSREPAAPPDVLFHGTSHAALDGIRRDGLKPMRRQYVHLSIDRDTAERVGRRKGGTTVVLPVDAKAAQHHGVSFYRGNEDIWLSDPIPARFITLPED